MKTSKILNQATSMFSRSPRMRTREFCAELISSELFHCSALFYNFTHLKSSLLPMMAISYMFQFLDKSAMSFTSILGLTEDLNLQGGDYSWASSIYYFGYLAASYLAAVSLVRFSVGKLISTSMCVLNCFNLYISVVLTLVLVLYGGLCLC